MRIKYDLCSTLLVTGILIWMVGVFRVTEVTADQWLTFRGNVERTGTQVDQYEGWGAPFEKAWTALQGDPKAPDVNLIIEASPLVANGRVYVATLFNGGYASPIFPLLLPVPLGDLNLNSSLVCLDLETGDYLWHTPLGSEGLWATPTISEDGTVVYVPAWDGYVYAVNALNGEIIWQTQIDEDNNRSLRASPVLHDGFLYVATYEMSGTIGQLFRLDAASGEIVSLEPLEGGVYGSPVLLPENRLLLTISFPEKQETLIRVFDIGESDLHQIVWETPLVGQSFSTGVYRGGNFYHQTSIVMTTGDSVGWLYVLDADTGELLISPYELTYPSWNSPAVDEKNIYTADRYGSQMIALDKVKFLEGHPDPVVWRYHTPDQGYIVGSPTLVSGLVFFSTDDNGERQHGVLYGLRVLDGEPVLVYDGIFGDGVGSAQASPAVADGKIIFTSYDDRQGIESGVYAFQSTVPAPSQPEPILIETGITGDVLNHNWKGFAFSRSYDAVPVLFGAMQTTDGGDTAGLRFHALDTLGFQVKVEEEQSRDSEIAHTTEVLGYLALPQGDIVDVSGNIIGETGVLSANQDKAGSWKSLDLSRSYTDPVVIMNMVTYNGGQPAHIRLRNVTGNRFEYKIEEWKYLDVSHTTEMLHYLVVERGRHQMAGGIDLLSEIIEAAHGFKTVSFPQSFSADPVVVTQTQTVYEMTPVVTRQKSLTPSGFKIEIEEEEAQNRIHATETVGYVAVGKR